MAASEVLKCVLLLTMCALPFSLRFDVSPLCTQNSTCTRDVQAALGTCARSNSSSCEVVFDQGVFAMSSVYIDAMRNVVIMGSGDSTVLLTNLTQLFTITRGSLNITFKSFAVDMERVPYTLGNVTRVNTTSSEVTFDASTPLYAVDVTRHPYLQYAAAILSYDVGRDRFAINGTDLYAPAHKPFSVSFSHTGSNASSSVLTINVPLTLADTVIVRHVIYDYNVFTAMNSAQISVQNVSLWAAGGMVSCTLFNDPCCAVIT
jgi:hypothetical protein